MSDEWIPKFRRRPPIMVKMKGSEEVRKWREAMAERMRVERTK